MSPKAMKWAWEQAIPPKPKLALLALADACDEQGHGTVTVSKLAEMCDCENFEMAHRLDLLLDAGLIEIYVLNPAPGSQISVVLNIGS